MPFLPEIILPPNVVLSFSYIRGLFVYCPILLDPFIGRGCFCYFFFLFPAGGAAVLSAGGAAVHLEAEIFRSVSFCLT